jgi:sensitive to high expression protein 9
MAATRLAARQAKVAYDQAVACRSNSQREVNELLHRKSNWTDGDVSRFTALVRQDHIYEQKEATTKHAVHETEDAVEREFSELMRSILARYHEEQIWSDKIRSASTYGSLGALALNLLIFVLAVVVVEPWRRQKLTQGFEKRIAKIGLDNAALLEKGLKEMDRRLERQRVLLMEITTGTTGEKYTSADVDRRSLTRHQVSIRDVGQAITATTAVVGLFGWLARWWFEN